MNEDPREENSVGRRRGKWRRVLGIGVPIVVVGVLLWQGAKYGMQAGRQTSCLGNLKMIGFAMLDYAEVYGCFPPAYIPDKEGRPMHSWRVLIMPFLNEQAFLDSYRFDEPWNSPHNRALAHGVPHGMDPNYPIYHCPSDRDSDKWDTSFVMVVGPQTISDGPSATGRNDVPDGISNTVFIVEMCDSGIHWMEPRDLRFDEMSFKINDPDGRGLRSKHPGGVSVVTGDCVVHVLRLDIDPRVLKGLLTRNGREIVPDF